MKGSYKGKRNKTNMASYSKSESTPTGIAAALLGDSELEKVLGEAVALYHRLRIVADEVHHQGEMTSGKGGVLAGLYRFGPQTVPQMARARPVSRQYIRTLVNMLADDGLVEFIDNPAHKRSRLVSLTKRGEVFVDEMIKKQKRLFSKINIGIPEMDLRNTANILRDVRVLFEGKELEKILKKLSK